MNYPFFPLPPSVPEIIEGVKRAQLQQQQHANAAATASLPLIGSKISANATTAVKSPSGGGGVTTALVSDEEGATAASNDAGSPLMTVATAAGKEHPVRYRIFDEGRHCFLEMLDGWGA